MCRNGQVQEAYELAKEGLAMEPTSQWAQRALGWTLYYLIKGDAGKGDFDRLIVHFDELRSLELLTIENDSMIFDNVQWQIAQLIRNYFNPEDWSSTNRLSNIFERLRDYNFNPSKGHSILLQSFIKFNNWQEMANFIDWWDLDKLTPEDFTPFVMENGRNIMTLAERAYIAQSKALLRLNDTERIRLFLPKIEKLMNQHGEMTYPGYFYGKLLIKLGNNNNEALRFVIPFARRKASEFWVWQMLSELFQNDEEKQLACLLRAVHCRTEENFLVKIRIKLAQLYITRGELNKARYHIDTAVRCYSEQGWRLPNEIDDWIHQPWLNQTTPDGNDPINYRSITDEFLCEGAEECIAVVTYVNPNNQRCSMIYGIKKQMSQRLPIRVSAGDVIKLRYVTDRENHVNILSANKTSLPDGLRYAKTVEGTISKRNGQDFASLKTDSINCFIAPNIVNKFALSNNDHVKGIAVYDYNKRKKTWNWVCVNIKR